LLEDIQAVEEQRRTAPPMQFEHAESSAVTAAEPERNENDAADTRSEKVEPFVRQGRKVGRNEPCPCGSGKKYKQCHGKVA